MVNHGLVVAPLFLIIVLLTERAGGTRGHHEDGRARVPRAGARVAVPDRRARDAGDAGVGELRRRVPDPARAVRDEARRSRSSRSRASRWRRSTCCGCSSARCTTARARAVESRELRFGDALVIVPLVLAILAFALYPAGGADRLRARGQGGGPAGGAMKGPTIDWAAISPLIALTAGACLVLMVGLLRPAFARHAVVPGLTGADARRRGRARRLAVGREHERDRGRAGDRRPDAGAADDLRGRRARGGGAVAAVAGRGRGGRGRVPRAAARRRARHGRARGRDEPRVAVHRLRAALDPLVRHVRDGAAARDVARVRPEVPDRRVARVGGAALRPGAALRRDGLDGLRRDRRGRRRRSPTTCSS